jgi:hypothetical protein
MKKSVRQTSINCFNQIKKEGLLSKRRLEVYEAIFKNAPCTTNEALKDIYSGSHGVGSRTTELRDCGVIYEKGIRKCAITGRNVIEWDLTDNLPKELKRSNRKNKLKVLKEMIADLQIRDSIYSSAQMNQIEKIQSYIDKNF